MEYLELGDLLKYIPRKGLPEPQVKVIMHQLFDAVGFLHEENTAHRDLKPEVRHFNASDFHKMLNFD